MKVELLAPAGNREALVAAVQNGADAIYLAGQAYGARAYANNFTLEEIAEVISYCHAYEVKVYITMNTVLYQDEIEQAYEVAKTYYTMGVDAILVQDFGLAYLIHERLPKAVIHASTQMHAHNVDAVKVLRDAGFERVVVARETPLPLIEQMCKQGVEIEMFVHGALCVSYSGQCLMSSVNQIRSGNRGQCAQPCRFKYELYRDGKKMPLDQEYLLSPKDLNTLKRVPELIRSGVCSLKIEGRMKRPEYVAAVVRAYREAIDASLRDETYQVEEEELMKIFHRGFTEGHVFDKRGPELMNPVRPNHVGIPLGRVVGYKNHQVQIELFRTLHQHDGIRILQQKDFGILANKIYLKGRLVNQAHAHDIVAFDCDEYVKVGSDVVLTTDSHQLLQLQKTYETLSRYQPCTLSVYAHVNEPLRLMIVCGGVHAYVQSDVLVSTAQTRPITQEKLEEQLMKTKDTEYVFESITYDMDENIFLPIQAINQARRDGLQILKELMTQQPSMPQVEEKAPTFESDSPSIRVVVHTQAQVEVALEYPYEIYTDSIDLQKTYPTLGYVSLRVNEDNTPSPCEQVVASELGQLFQQSKDITASYWFHSGNIYAAMWFQKHGVKRVGISQEITDERLSELMLASQKFEHLSDVWEKTVYGRRELMVSKYCAPNTYDSKTHRPHCNLCKHHTYELRDYEHRYPLLFDETCKMHILEADAWDTIDRMGDYRNMGIQHFQLIFTTETAQEMRDVLNRL